MFKLNFKIANFEDKFSLSGRETYNEYIMLQTNFWTKLHIPAIN